jgi:hypothetical protein
MKTSAGRIAWTVVGQMVATCSVIARLAGAQEALPPCCAVREPLTQAWWTGPMLAVSAATLPPGHVLIEPYFYDVTTARSNGFGSRAYVLYGLADRLTVGVLPIVGYNKVIGGPSSSGVGLGDLTLLAQYGLTKFHEGSWFPAIGVMAQQTFPIGKFDRLGRLSDGFGGGAYTTTLALNSQTYAWLPNGRILRLRLDVSQALSSRANVEDVSVYGTTAGFRGHAQPGSSFFSDLAAEYSVSQRWVLALDVTYGHTANGRVAGHNVLGSRDGQNPSSILLNSGASDAFGAAPAIEYNWTPNLGALLGVRIIAAGHNTSASITPAVAINFVR